MPGHRYKEAQEFLGEFRGRLGMCRLAGDAVGKIQGTFLPVPAYRTLPEKQYDAKLQLKNK